jgi:uncharacterized protein (DUF3820 family)
MVLNFGKHKGKLIQEVPHLYLEWLMSLDAFYKNKAEVKREIVSTLVKAGRIKVAFDSSEDFNKSEWIPVKTPPKENSVVMTNPHNRVLIYSNGRYYSIDTWLIKEGVTHYKTIQ